jgi:hypothetical protein
VGVDLVVADERGELVARHQQREVQVPGRGRQVVGVVAVVDGLLALDELLVGQRVGDAAPLAGTHVQLLPEVALVDASRLPDEFQSRVLVLVEVGFGSGHTGTVRV